jgi:hypothetical protein
MAVGHFLTQAAAHGLLFGIIAAFPDLDDGDG